MRIVAIVQARMGSMRLPGKVLKRIQGKPLFEILINRLKLSHRIDEIVLATTTNLEDDALCHIAESLGVGYFRGEIDNVLSRFYLAAKEFKADVIIRITGDCPLVDFDIIDRMIDVYCKSKFDYLSNNHPPSFPDGLDAEIFSFVALEEANKFAEDKFDKEHVTPYIYSPKSNFNVGVFECELGNYSNLRWTVDELEDYQLLCKIFEETDYDFNIGWQKILDLFLNNKELNRINNNISRDEGAILGTGQKLWKRAKKVIPGGNMLLSKRSEMFLPDFWPSYFEKSKGCYVWDLDDNKYLDMSIMGIGTNTLGYGNDFVDSAVFETIKKGNMSTLNCPEEVYLAEKLIEMHTWAKMVKLTRSGGEANAVAIRIARAASGKDGVAICGYHGWHDWYLSANLISDSKLNQHLMPGLSTDGVPTNLTNTVFPFNYNHIEELVDIISSNSIGVIIMEVMRNFSPEYGFLEEVKSLAVKNGIVLIFDECTSGFRETFGGLHKKFNVVPDIAMFGKALGNGYAINAIIGSKEVMEAAQNTFISSTFWTERIGPTAALNTLKVMEEIKSWEIITEIGNKVVNFWNIMSETHKVDIEISGIPALCSFNFSGESNLLYKTFLTQELLKNKILASNSFYASIAHKDSDLQLYFQSFEKVIEQIANLREDIVYKLEGPICHSGFKRLN